MQDVVDAFSRAVTDFFHPRMLALIVIPLLAALLLWGAIAVFFWDDWMHWLQHSIEQGWLSHGLFASWAAWLAQSLSAVLIVLLIFPLSLVTALVVTAVCAMPPIVHFVAQRRFPALEERHGGGFVGSIVNALGATIIFAILWLVTLPLWLTGILGIVLPLLLSMYLNQRLFRYDALAEHASAAELPRVLARAKWRLYGMGLLIAALYYIPVINLLIPVLGGLAFAQLCLGELARMRKSEYGNQRSGFGDRSRQPAALP
jgi:uncharacterized protein involved in cysteine biosynthesis